MSFKKSKKFNDGPAPPPPTTFTEANRKTWTDWLKKHANWHSEKNLTVKNIQVVKQHTWTDALKDAHAKSYGLEVKDLKERYLYHGTSEHNIDSILSVGFHNGEKGATWLAQSPFTSVPYMKGGKRLILSSVLVRTAMEGVGEVSVVKGPNRIVPIAVIELGGPEVERFSVKPPVKKAVIAPMESSEEEDYEEFDEDPESEVEEFGPACKRRRFH
ncbi:hypothetical protein HK097_007086 [Rhizophlyctis rosea]|uniref:PARP catalytic domain-containing protein n=1 Tax=Rhizophlyctis rosea TaxID=64517 RepID=A0AAD5X1V2_9FUNG|nr:hypothetical protein HK097_007086 [Rhizophlyctis rosea]